jgi:hypothetical protein
VSCPEEFQAPWDGYYECFPLPGLRDGKTYVADLSKICPVASEALAGKRIACLAEGALAFLFHRLALNSSRLNQLAEHFSSEAQRLCMEMGLWDAWASAMGSEDGFQAWLVALP